MLMLKFIIIIVIISFIIANNGMFMKLVTVNNMDTNNGYQSRLSRQLEPIDVVYTWVNESDPKFVQDLLTWKVKLGDVHYSSSESKGFKNWNTLLFSLRSIKKYADWIRHVFIVTNGQIPHWLNLSCPRVTIVTHELRHSKTYVRDCTAECSIIQINNNQCDEECNKEQCEWDGRDCGIKNVSENVDVALVKQFNLYQGSIFHTAAIFNAAFGNVKRMIPAHVPHFIDRDVMTELQNRFPREWDQTSFHRFRKAITLQYAFAYYHYIMAPAHNQTRFTIEKNDHMYLMIDRPNNLIKTLESLLNSNKVCVFERSFNFQE